MTAGHVIHEASDCSKRETEIQNKRQQNQINFSKKKNCSIRVNGDLVLKPLWLRLGNHYCVTYSDNTSVLSVISRFKHLFLLFLKTSSPLSAATIHSLPPTATLNQHLQHLSRQSGYISWAVSVQGLHFMRTYSSCRGLFCTFYTKNPASVLMKMNRD